MAETSRITALPSSSDAEPYVPISWTAVAAFAAAVGFALLLFILAVDSRYKKRPLLEPELVLISVAVVVVLSYVGRRTVRNSEGTTSGRALGMDLCTTAWWIAVVLGLGYFAYRLAILMPVEREAHTQVEKWISNINQGEFAPAFHQVIPPGGRKDIASGDLTTMQARYRQDYTNFRQSQLVRVAQRNKGECRFEPAGMSEAKFQAGSLTCNYGGEFVTPEGKFTLVIPMKAVDLLTGDREKVSGGRQWQILPDPGGYVIAQELTPYGNAIAELIASGEDYGRSFVYLQLYGPATRREAYVRYIEQGNPIEDKDLSPLAAVGGWMVLGQYPPSWLDATSDRVFTREGGAAPSPEERTRFRRMWRTNGLLPPGSRLKESRDQGESLTFTDQGLELRVPVELPLPGEGGDPGAAVGRVVVVCNDPAVLAKLKELKAGTTTSTELPPAHWRVVRVESDLHVQHSGRTPQPGPDN